MNNYKLLEIIDPNKIGTYPAIVSYGGVFLR